MASSQMCRRCLSSLLLQDFLVLTSFAQHVSIGRFILFTFSKMQYQYQKHRFWPNQTISPTYISLKYGDPNPPASTIKLSVEIWVMSCCNKTHFVAKRGRTHPKHVSNHHLSHSPIQICYTSIFWLCQTCPFLYI